MKSRINAVFLFISGALIGGLFSLQFTAFADKPDSPLPLDELRELSEVFSIIKNDYVEPVKDKDLLISAISGMVSSLDPHSTYLDKKTLKEFSESTQGKFVGLGIEVGMENELVKVISPIDDSPAARAGIRSLDMISRIDQTPVRGLTLDEAVKKMRGEPGSKVTLTVLRPNENKPLFFTLIREEIRTVSVKGKIVENGFAWVRINQFQERTVEDFVAKLTELAKGDIPLKGLVLDLRNNPGGLLQGAIGISATFIKPDDLVVSTNGQLAEHKIRYTASPNQYSSAVSDPLRNLPPIYKTVPIIVLVNSGSASASEIVAGALQDYGRAIILGSQTYGKGSVQSVRWLSENSAVKLTTARYYTPKGRSIQAKGIVPDFLVNERENGLGIDGLRVREVDLSKHLPNVTESEAPKNVESDEELFSKIPPANLKPIEWGSPEDFQLQQALNKLKGQPIILAKKPESAKSDPAAANKESTGRAEKPENKSATDK